MTWRLLGSEPNSLKRKKMTLYFKLFLRLFLAAALTFAAGALWAGDAARIVLAAGEVNVGGAPALVGQTVREGQPLVTGPNGYLYLETMDKGFFILRPNSSGQIVTYQIDTLNPANTRIKLELKKGVARHISGDAVKAARSHFRFNTPVAAVGVRGTDFTIFTSQDTTRITVLSGGIVASPLSDACAAAGYGPCNDPASRELFANKTSLMLQINRGQSPLLLKGIEQSPDLTAPPRSDEPAGTQAGTRTSVVASNGDATLGDKLNPLKSDLINQLLPQAAVLPQLIWGRWQALLDQTIEVDVAALQATNQLISTNAYYALMRNRSNAWQPPTQTSLGFSLQQSQAVIMDETSRQVSVAKIENGLLQVDFAKSSFFTRFDLVNSGERIQLQNNGEVTSDGKLFGGLQFLRPNNMSVTGALASDNNTAAYLFQSRIDDRRLASGAAYWGK